jgi:hypothetical protein
MPCLLGAVPHSGKEGGMKDRKLALTLFLLPIGILAAAGLVAWLWLARK